MKFCKVQGQSDYFSGIWIVKGAALWYAVHRANRSAEGAALQHRKGEGYGTYQSSNGRRGTVNKGKFCANCGTPRP